VFGKDTLTLYRHVSIPNTKYNTLVTSLTFMAFKRRSFMEPISRVIKNPIARKRWKRLKEMRRAYISLWLLVVLYVLSLGAELLCNDAPLYVRYFGRSYFPVFKFYPEDIFTGSGKQTRPDYHQINCSAGFKKDSNNYMIFPPIAFGPEASINPESIDIPDLVEVRFLPMPMLGSVNISEDYVVVRSLSFGPFIGKAETEVKNLRLTDFFDVPEDIRRAVRIRFKNEGAPAASAEIQRYDGKTLLITLSTFSKRKRRPRSVRLTFKEMISQDHTDTLEAAKIEFDRGLHIVSPSRGKSADALWSKLSDRDKSEVLRHVESRFLGPLDSIRMKIEARTYSVSFEKEDIRFPFRPVKGHIMGIDAAGRDVFARILYGLRTSMTFGLLLVFASMVLGVAAGALQGYYGGAVDITGQRVIEIWSALPFLYIMILMGSVYGRSFPLLLFCYGIFNWIGISYYTRAEFLRLRKQPFVEAAKCMGIASRKIIFKHILPNGLVPVITFFPFSLVGAIGALAALDYLGFGLPPPTPSWGELLFQAQQFRWAWWLILYPSLALFTVMLLGVFVGEGIRNAYDPKRYTRLD
jgi:microcin C transport system permease protein